MIDSECLDTSAWLAYFDGEKSCDVVDADVLIITSVISLLEIKRKLIQQWRLPEHKAESLIQFVKDRAMLVDVTAELAETAASNAIAHKLHAIDAVIYATAQTTNSRLITYDNDFRDLPDTIILRAG